MKARTKQRRTFLGAPTCLGAVAWSVDVHPHYDKKKHPNKMVVSGEITINKDGSNHYVDCEADMKPVYRMQRELHRFVYELEAAIAEAKAHNEGEVDD